MTIAIEKLQQENTGLLDHIAADVFDEPINNGYLKQFVDDPRHVMYLAVDNNQVVGMASGVEYFHPDKPPQLWINEVGVASSHRCRGIGRQLVQALIDEAEERNCVYAWLGTDNDNIAGNACFGSVPDGEAPQPFLLYEWDLED